MWKRLILLSRGGANFWDDAISLIKFRFVFCCYDGSRAQDAVGTAATHRTRTHCNKLQHTATLCTTLQHAAAHCSTLSHTATLYNTLQHTTIFRNTLAHSHTLSHMFTAKFLPQILQHSATLQTHYHTPVFSHSSAYRLSHSHSLYTQIYLPTLSRSVRHSD